MPRLLVGLGSRPARLPCTVRVTGPIRAYRQSHPYTHVTGVQACRRLLTAGSWLAAVIPPAALLLALPLWPKRSVVTDTTFQVSNSAARCVRELAIQSHGHTRVTHGHTHRA